MQFRNTSKKGILWKHLVESNFKVIFLLHMDFFMACMHRGKKVDRSGYQSGRMWRQSRQDSADYFPEQKLKRIMAQGPVRKRQVHQGGKQEHSLLFWRESTSPISQRGGPQEEDHGRSLGFYQHQRDFLSKNSELLDHHLICLLPFASWPHSGFRNPLQPSFDL